ncbi:MAG: hypothetical protein AB7N76_32220 [Planctomycetota bacterium]
MTSDTRHVRPPVDSTRRFHREAQQLIARWRAGALSRAALEQAAYLDHTPARIAADAPAPPLGLEPWLRGLRRFPVAVELRALAATVRFGLSAPPAGAVQTALVAALAACRDPGRAGEAARAAPALARAHCGAAELGQGFYRYATRSSDAELVYYLACAAGDPGLWLGRDAELWGETDPIPPTLWGPPDDLLVGAALSVARDAARGLALRAAIRDELAPWLLGLGDPLERV